MIEGYIVGLYPRDDELIDIWKKWERKLVSDKEFRIVLNKSIEKAVRIQETAKLSYIHDPQMNWHDLFRPFTDLNNIVSGSLTRYFENNIFYRKPFIKDMVKYENGLLSRYTHEDLLTAGKKWLISLPGPYTFFTLSEFHDKEIAEKSIINILIGASEEAVSLGYDAIIFHEPSIAYYNNIDWDIVKRFYRIFLDAGIEYKIHLYFGDISSKIGRLLDISPYGFSIDTSYTLLENIEYLPSENIVLGIVDAQNTLMEDPVKTASAIRKFIKRMKFKYVGLTPNTDLDYLPYNIAYSKIMLLSNILERVRK